MKRAATVELIDKYFGFLVKEYGFKRLDATTFDNGYIQIGIESDDPKSIAPEITFWLKSEPGFTRIELGWLLFEQIDRAKTWQSTSYEENFAYYANKFHENADQLIYSPNSLLLPGMKRLFINMIKFDRLTKANYLNNMSPNARKYYQYIKKKDPKWDPGKYL